jgi:predicted dithiol-disulfide oxidoreductase (DUF899 family)
VNWLRAKARYQRWVEELIIVENEMKWTLEWFTNQEENWKRRVEWAKDEKLEGHMCYAEKQINLWQRMKERCKNTWGNN